MTKPRVITRCVANQYTGANERIIEFSSQFGGGLISFYEQDDGTLSVCVYRCDKTVEVVTPHREKAAAPVATLQRIYDHAEPRARASQTAIGCTEWAATFGPLCRAAGCE